MVQIPPELHRRPGAADSGRPAGPPSSPGQSGVWTAGADLGLVRWRGHPPGRHSPDRPRERPAGPRARVSMRCWPAMRPPALARSKISMRGSRDLRPKDVVSPFSRAIPRGRCTRSHERNSRREDRPIGSVRLVWPTRARRLRHDRPRVASARRSDVSVPRDVLRYGRHRRGGGLSGSPPEVARFRPRERGTRRRRGPGRHPVLIPGPHERRG